MCRIGVVVVTLSVQLVCCWAGAQGTQGLFTGTVTGPNQSLLSGAVVTIRNMETGSVVTAVAGGRGLYRSARFDPGTYELTADLQGFEPVRVTAKLADGEARGIDFMLPIATIRETVTVIGSAPRASLEAAAVRESSGRDIGEALAETNGVWKLRKGGIANDVVLRGFQSKDLNVLIDGERIYGACPNHMDPPAFHADFAEVERVEIAKGPFDVRNQGSLGGVINIVTRRPESGLHMVGNISSGSFGYINPSATVSFGNPRFSALAGFSYRSSGPYTDGSGKRFTEYVNYRPDALDSDAFRLGTAWANLSAVPMRNHLAQISYARQSADHVLYPYLQMDAVYDNADRIRASYLMENVSRVVKSLGFHGYFTQVHHWMTDQYRLSSSGVAREYSMGTIARSRTYGGRAETVLGGITAGMEGFRREWYAVTSMAPSAYRQQYSIPDAGTVAIGVYVEYQKSLSDELKVDAGGRIDKARSSVDPSIANTSLYYAYNATRATSAHDTLPSGNVRISYSSRSGLELTAGVGHTERVPEAQERYFALSRMGSDWVGNPRLAPSRNTGLDGSLGFRRRALSIGSNLFFNRVIDFIALNRQPKVNAVSGVMNSLARSYQNVDATICGGETEIGYVLSQRLFLAGNLAYVRGTQTPDPQKGIHSQYLAEMPPLRSRAALRYDTGRLSAEIEGVLAARQQRVDTDLNEKPTAGYGTANLKLGIAFRRWFVRGGLNNILNKQYYEHLSYQRDPFRSGTRIFEPGRNLFVQISYRH